MSESWNIIDLRLRAYELASDARPVGATFGETLGAAQTIYNWLSSAQPTTGQGVPVEAPKQPRKAKNAE